jgi:serine/threonine-protein kinase
VEAIATKQSAPLPERIGSYQVLRQLSGTGSVQVYLAHEDGPLGFSRDVILKVAPQSPDDETRDTKELGREATACAKLNHPGIVRTHHFFEHEGALVLVLEHVDGITLTELLASPGGKGRRLDDDAAFHVGISILEALAHAHGMLNEQGRSAPVIHRAVSPSNVLVGRDGVVKLGGFGFAKISGGGSDTTGSLTWEPAYMAPEQVSEKQPTPKVDVYAAALILWELLTGRPATILPRDPLAVEGILRAVTQRKPQPLATIRKDLPKELVAAVDAALTFSPDKRTITCGELAKWMRKVVHVGQAKTMLATRVRAVLAASAARGDRQPDRQPAKGAVVGSPIVSIAAAPVVVPSGTPAAPPPSNRRERTLHGVAPPSSNAVNARALLPAPPPVKARAAQLPPPPLEPPEHVAIPSAPPMEGPPIQKANSLPPPPDYASMDPVAAAAALQQSFVERLTEALNRPSFFESLSQTLKPRSVLDRILSAWLLPSSAQGSSEPGQRTSLVERLKAPTRFSRNVWLGAWIGLAGLLPVLIVGLSRRSAVKTASAPQTAAVLVVPPPPPPPVPVALAEPEEPPPPSPVEEPAQEDPPTAADLVGSSESLARRGLGNVTVHSLASHASVYVMLARYGKVEEKLTLPCGKRFLAIGVQAPARREPIWLAPGRMILIPCGGTLDVTMNPHALRKPTAAAPDAAEFNPTQL